MRKLWHKLFGCKTTIIGSSICGAGIGYCGVCDRYYYIYGVNDNLKLKKCPLTKEEAEWMMIYGSKYV